VKRVRGFVVMKITVNVDFGAPPLDASFDAKFTAEIGCGDKLRYERHVLIALRLGVFRNHLTSVVLPQA
jgi:hypothetical protein